MQISWRRGFFNQDQRIEATSGSCYWPDRSWNFLLLKIDTFDIAICNWKNIPY